MEGGKRACTRARAFSTLHIRMLTSSPFRTSFRCVSTVVATPLGLPFSQSSARCLLLKRTTTSLYVSQDSRAGKSKLRRVRLCARLTVYGNALNVDLVCVDLVCRFDVD
eukprot:4505455-Pleurochrysis_carterae.AAC.1